MRAKSNSNVVYMAEWLALRDMKHFQKINPMEQDDYLNFIYGKPVDLVFMLSESLEKVNHEARSDYIGDLSSLSKDEKKVTLDSLARLGLIDGEAEEMDTDD